MRTESAGYNYGSVSLEPNSGHVTRNVDQYCGLVEFVSLSQGCQILRDLESSAEMVSRLINGHQLFDDRRPQIGPTGIR